MHDCIVAASLCVWVLSPPPLCFHSVVTASDPIVRARFCAEETETEWNPSVTASRVSVSVAEGCVNNSVINNLTKSRNDCLPVGTSHSKYLHHWHRGYEQIFTTEKLSHWWRSESSSLKKQRRTFYRNVGTTLMGNMQQRSLRVSFDLWLHVASSLLLCFISKAESFSMIIIHISLLTNLCDVFCPNSDNTEDKETEVKEESSGEDVLLNATSP